MEPETTTPEPTTGTEAALRAEASQGTGFTEQAHIIVTESFEAVLFPSGLLLSQGDNIVRLMPSEALAVAGAILLGYDTSVTPEATDEPESPSS